MTEGQVAGRLEVLVEATLAGFKQKLKSKVEAASKGVDAEVGVKIDAKALRTRLKKAVREAAEGVDAEITVSINAKALRKNLEKRVAEASAGVTATIGVDLDAKTLKAKVKAAAEAAGTDVKIGVDQKHTKASLKKLLAEVEKDGARGGGLKVPITTRGKLWLAAKVEQAKAQTWLNGNPLTVPIQTKAAGGKGAGIMGGLGKLIKPGIIVGLVSLIQPAVGAIGQLAGGLGAMVGAAAPALGTLAAFPIAISTVITSMAGLKIATQGVGDAMKVASKQQEALAAGTKLTAAEQEELDKAMQNVSPSARRFIKNTIGLKDEWQKARKQIQQPLFKALADEIKPVANALLPTLTKGLKGTSTSAGRVVRDFAALAKTSRFQKDLGGVFRQNNKTLEAGGSAIKNMASGWLSFQRAAAPFQRDINKGLRRASKAFSDKMAENRENGSTAAFLDKAEDRLKKVWSITKQVGSGIRGIFAAGDASGMRLLDSMDQWSQKWADWTHSDGGKAKISGWFDAVEPGFREFVDIIKDSGKAMLDWADDPSTTEFLKKIHDDFGPALNELLTSLGQETSGNVIDILSQLAKVASDLAPVVNIFANLTGAVVSLVGALTSLADSGNPAVSTLAKIAEGALVLKVLSSKGGLLAGLLGGGAKGAAAKGGGGLLAGLLGGAALGAGGGKHAAKPDAKKSRAGLIAMLGTYLGVEALSALDNATDGKPREEDLYKQFSKGGTVPGKFLFGSSGHTLKNDVQSAYTHKSGLGKGQRDISQFGASLFGKDSELQESTNNVNKLDKALAGLKSPDQRTEEWNKVLKETGLSAADLGKVLPKTYRAMGVASSGIGASLKGVTSTIMSSLDKAKLYDERMRSLPTEVQTQITTPGAIKTMQDVRDLGLLYNLTPRQIQTVMKLEGFSPLQQKIVALGKRYTSLPKQVRTKVQTPGALNSLRDVENLGKQFGLTPAQIKTLMEVTGTAPAAKKVSGLRAEIDRIKSKMVNMSEKGAEAAKARIAALRAQIAALRDKSITITTTKVNKVVNQGRAMVAGGGAGHGGNTATVDARGSIHLPYRTSMLVRRFGRGGLNPDDRANAHQPKIYGPGPTRVFREPETHGEGYVPLANDSRRPRAKAIVAKLAEMFGGVAQFARGGLTKAGEGLTRFARGGVNADRSVGAGVRTGAPATRRANARVLHEVTDETQYRKAGKKAKKHAKKHIAPAVSKALAEQKKKLNAKLATQQGIYDSLVGKKTDITSSLAESGKDYSSVTSIADENGGYVSPTGLIASLKARVAKTVAYQNTLKALRASGKMGNALYEQLLNAGVEVGGPLVSQLKNATGAQLAEIDSLQGQITGAAGGIAKEAAAAMYDAGIAAAKALIAGLTSQLKHLGKAGKKAGGKDKKKDKKNGGGKGDGKPKPKKPPKGGGGGRVTPTAAASLHAATRPTVAATETAAPPAPAAAPLIGQLIIQGNSSEEIADAYEQTMFAMRRIKQGGIYADATS